MMQTSNKPTSWSRVFVLLAPLTFFTLCPQVKANTASATGESVCLATVTATGSSTHKLPRFLPSETLQQKLDIIDKVSGLGIYSQTDLLAALMASSPTNMTHEERHALAQEIVRRIPIGTTRADVERIFPDRNGGINDASLTQYYFGSEVTISAPFNHRGNSSVYGNEYYLPCDTVNGPITIYRSWAVGD